MNSYRVRLSQKSSSTSQEVAWIEDTTARPTDSFLLERRYRSYLADPRWLPATPVKVTLNGRRNGCKPVTLSNGYELDFLCPQQPGLGNWKRKVGSRLVTLAAAAAVVLPLGSAAAADNIAPPPSAPCTPNSARWGPPTNTLSQEPKAIKTLTDAMGRPVRLAGFHQNVAPGHTNNSPAHTNTWNNHSNAQGHVNQWQNHSNVPYYVIPHTNIVPGDFIY